jgi:hypothetical protein
MPEVFAADQSGIGDPNDVLRSVRRYIAQALGSPPWTVRLQRTAVADDERPVAILEPGPLTTPFARRAINQGDVQKQQTITVVCYPEVGADTASSAQTAREVVALLDASISRGLIDGETGVNIGAPFRIPVYFFETTPIEGVNRKGPDDPYMHINVDETFAIRPVQDAMDERRYTVVATLRVNWWQGGRVPPFAPIATRILPGQWSETPPGG